MSNVKDTFSDLIDSKITLEAIKRSITIIPMADEPVLINLDELSKSLVDYNIIPFYPRFESKKNSIVEVKNDVSD